MVEKHLETNYTKTNTDCKYSINGKEGGANVNSTSRNALVESAIIHFYQIYSKGNKCNGIAQNRGDPEVDNFRDSLEKFTILKLGWSSEKFSEFKKNIFDTRNQFFAHYDAKKANYKVHLSGVSSRRMVGCKLDKDNIAKLTKVIGIMIEYIIISLNK
ncbi:MAG: hypothetical protein KAU01_11390 [Candidatus Cloacimonetes bacterium]|nr:hypothetical protein [Candidatus Cloacimonadota bacterium]